MNRYDRDVMPQNEGDEWKGAEGLPDVTRIRHVYVCTWNIAIYWYKGFGTMSSYSQHFILLLY